MRVLVAYASKYGATEGIARRIGDVLRDRGHQVSVMPCQDVADASTFDAYVVGSAAYAFNWRKAARMFVHRNVDLLSAHPVWIFSSGPLGTEQVDENGADVLKGAEPKQFDEYAPLIHPRGTKVFRGAFDPNKLRGGDRMVAWLPALRDLLREGDFREWDKVDAWAAAISEQLEPAVAGASRDDA